MQKFIEARREWETMYWRALLCKHDWNVKHVADESGVHRSHVYRYLRKLDIELPKHAMRYTSAHANRGTAAWQELRGKSWNADSVG